MKINFWKKNSVKKIIIISVLIIILIIAGIFFFRDREPKLNLYEVSKRDLFQEVSLTGKVKSADSVRMSFERSGRVSDILVSSGDRVRKDDILSKIDNSRLEAELLRVEAEHNHLLSPARPEEISAKRNAIQNARAVSVTSKNDLLYRLSDQRAEFMKLILHNIDRFFINPRVAPDLYFGVDDTDLELKIESEKEELTRRLLAWSRASNLDAREEASIALEALSSLRQLSDTLLRAFNKGIIIPYSPQVVSGWEADTVKIRTFASESASLIMTQRERYVTSLNTLSALESDLALLLAPPNIFQLEAVRANISAIKADMEKGIIRSTINGIVGNINIREGEMATSGAPIITIISDKNFQIEAYIPEADIDKIQINDTAKVILDAFGRDYVFDASIITIDPGETIIDGVTFYRAVFEFISQDDRIKSGMTANIDVLGNTLKEVVAIPQRVIISSDGKRFVNLLKDGVATKVEVHTGFRGSDGYVEIIKGVNSGDKIILNSSR